MKNKIKDFNEFLNEFELEGQPQSPDIGRIIHTGFMSWNGWGDYSFKINNDEFQTIGYGEDDNPIDIIDVYSSSSIPVSVPIITYELNTHKKDIEYTIYNQREVNRLLDYLENRKYIGTPDE